MVVSHTYLRFDKYEYILTVAVIFVVHAVDKEPHISSGIPDRTLTNCATNNHVYSS